ncbi:MAG: MBL fold metallo-hydrolase [Ruminiclostridium sp.]|nr:MBL fold metallo-hydrolase [Ruminiclostridium sp.]
MRILSEKLQEKYQHYVKYEVLKDVNIYLINAPVDSLGLEYIFLSFLIEDKKNDKNILIEVGPASASDTLDKTIKNIGINKIDYILLTHIHADHAGGIGHIIKYYPEAMIYAQEKGRKHLINPDRLWEGSIKALGKELTDAYDRMIGVPEKNILNEEPKIEGLTILDTPGHASHHNSFVFNKDGIQLIFSGEACGMIYGKEERKLVLEEGIDHQPAYTYLYPAAIPRFEYDIYEGSLNKLIDIAQEDCYIFYSHYGAAMNGKAMLDFHKDQIQLWRDIAIEETREYINSGHTQLEDAFIKKVTQRILEEDKFLKDYNNYRKEIQEFQYSYIYGSVHGFVDWAMRYHLESNNIR